MKSLVLLVSVTGDLENNLDYFKWECDGTSWNVIF